jgi:hypothetical protein
MDPSCLNGTSDYRARCVSILHVRCTASLGFLSDDTAWIRVDLEPPAAISRASVHGIGTTRRASRTPLQQEIKTSSWYSTLAPVQFVSTLLPRSLLSKSIYWFIVSYHEVFLVTPAAKEAHTIQKVTTATWILKLL